MLWTDCVHVGGQIMSQPLCPILIQIFFSFAQYVGKFNELVFGFLAEGTVPYVVVDLACPWEDVSSGAS